MSNFEALALLVATVVSGDYVLIFIFGKTLSITSIVQTGFANGVPVSVDYRRRLVWYWYFGVMNIGLLLLAIMALVSAQIGMSVDDPKLANVMYFCATMGALGALGWALGQISQMSYHLKLLRKDEGN